MWFSTDCYILGPQVVALFGCCGTFQEGPIRKKWVAGIMSLEVLAPGPYCSFLCFLYPPNWRCFLNTHAHQHDVLLMHVALQPWTGAIWNCEQNKCSALKLLSGTVGNRTKKANTWREVGSGASLVNSGRTDCNQMIRRMGKGLLAQLRASGSANVSEATIKTRW